MLVIDPEECIDCTLCIPECPVDAIYADSDVPEELKHFLELNERLAPQWPTIVEKKDSPEDAEQWDNVKDKLNLLKEQWD